MSNPDSRRPELEGAQKPPRDPGGFIFGAYSAAKRATRGGKTPSPKPSLGYAYLSSAVGGSYNVLSFGEAHARDKAVPPARRGGGPRGKVSGLSPASRLRFLRLLASVDRGAFSGAVYFLTLTYGDAWPEDPAACKRHLEAFRKRLKRAFGPFAGFWRLGIQERGPGTSTSSSSPPRPSGRCGSYAASWRPPGGRCAGSPASGPRTRDQRRAAEDPRGGGPRRALRGPKGGVPRRGADRQGLGAWRRGLLPARWEVAEVGSDDAFRIRRAFRRLAGKGGAGPVRDVRVFARHENVARLLRFLKGGDEHPRGTRRPQRTPGVAGTEASKRGGRG